MAIDLLLNHKQQSGITRIGEFGQNAPFTVFRVGGEIILIQMPVSIMSRGALLWDQRDFETGSVSAVGAKAGLDAITGHKDGGKFMERVGEIFKHQNVSRIGDTVGFRDAGDYMAHRNDKAVNPNKELTFSGLGYRNFNFEFEIVPTNKATNDAIAVFTATMQYYAAPDFAGEGKTYFAYPDLWEVSFVPDNYLPRIMPCYLTDYSINYAGAGKLVLHESAAPLAVTFSMTFTEAELHMRDKILSGYWG